MAGVRIPPDLSTHILLAETSPNRAAARNIASTTTATCPGTVAGSTGAGPIAGSATVIGVTVVTVRIDRQNGLTR